MTAILARRVGGSSLTDFRSACGRLGLPTSAVGFLEATVAPDVLLVTGLERGHGRFLKALRDSEESHRFPTWVVGDQEKSPGTSLLCGDRGQFDRLLDECRTDCAVLVAPIERALSDARPVALELGGVRLEFGTGTFLMGVVNVTPDSFSDGGKFFDAAAAIAHGQLLAEQGAALLDVGGESTRPGAASVSAEEEIRRVVPVITGLRDLRPVSVDTSKASVAEAAVAAGASLINDVTALGDPAMAEVAAKTGAALCLMHMQGTPRTMQASPQYGDVVAEVLAALDAAVARAVSAGVKRERILVDPGIGFGKTLAHNLELLSRLEDFRQLGLPILVGTSRKSMLGALTGGKPAAERVTATAATSAILAARGVVDVLRVHDVAENKDAISVGDALFRRPG